MPRGRPNRKRQRQIAKLRAAGLSYRQIGERFGVTGQSIYESLQRSGRTGAVAIRCRKCKTVITEARLASTNNSRACCMSCLPPTATFADRLKARRLAAGMTQQQLSLIRVLGLEWLAVE